MSRTVLQVFLSILGAFAVATSLAIIVAGPSAIPGSIPVNPTMDNEMRFYAVLWCFYGATALWCIKNVEHRGPYVRLLALMLFVCGLARTISAFVVGLPHPLFEIATLAEFVCSPLLVFLQSRIERAASAGRGTTVRLLIAATPRQRRGRA